MTTKDHSGSETLFMASDRNCGMHAQRRDHVTASRTEPMTVK